MPKPSTATPFPGAIQPVMPEGNDAYQARTMADIGATLFTTQRMTPVASSKAPKTPLDGMVRLSRYPWWPVAGQAADAWVYYDAAASLWRFLNTAPTSTH